MPAVRGTDARRVARMAQMTTPMMMIGTAEARRRSLIIVTSRRSASKNPPHIRHGRECYRATAERRADAGRQRDSDPDDDLVAREVGDRSTRPASTSMHRRGPRSGRRSRPRGRCPARPRTPSDAAAASSGLRRPRPGSSWVARPMPCPRPWPYTGNRPSAVMTSRAIASSERPVGIGRPSRAAPTTSSSAVEDDVLRAPPRRGRRRDRAAVGSPTNSVRVMSLR